MLTQVAEHVARKVIYLEDESGKLYKIHRSQLIKANVDDMYLTSHEVEEGQI